MKQFLCFSKCERAKSGAAISKTDYRSIINIVEYMAQNVDIALSLGEMAECAYMSPAKFKYTFQSVMGHSFSEHFFLLRMAKACDLLLNSNEYITAIAQSVGYKNVGSFPRNLSVTQGFFHLNIERQRSGKRNTEKNCA